jgi:serine/threonine protein kinase
MPISAGTKLGPYEVLSFIGAGGMGEVYKARDSRLDRFVAIKVLPENVSNDQELRQRFEREARLLASLSHPNICAIFDTGRQDSVDYLVMEFLDGQTLAQKLETGPLPLRETIRIALQIVDALDKAHSRGIIHRDLKPANVMMIGWDAKLLDFGLAKLKISARSDSETSLTTRANNTALGVVLGTLQYMAPEQLEGKEVDARTDVFAFGTLFYEMATGKRAFKGSSQAGLISEIMSAEPVPLSKLQPMTPALLERVINRCLAKDPSQRWQSARDLTTQLQKRWFGF